MKVIDDIGIEPIYQALLNDQYSKGHADYTPSSLNSPAYQTRLMKEHECTENASSMIWALLGTAVHHVIELAAEKTDYISERRFYGSVKTDYGAKIVGAQVDLFDHDTKTIYDMKVTSAYSVKDEPKEEWVSQLNVGRWCMAKEGMEIPEKLVIVAILRDWSKLNTFKDESYPKQQVKQISLPVWTLKETEEWIVSRINEIEHHLAADLETLEGCSDKEVWARPDKWAVVKKGQKRAVRLYDTREEAFSHAEGDDKLSVVKRAGERVRCSAYCGVSQFCKFANQ